jgi:hypothetical protein
LYIIEVHADFDNLRIFLLEIDLAFCMALALLNGLAISAGLGLLCAKIKELLKVMLINKAVL